MKNDNNFSNWLSKHQEQDNLLNNPSNNSQVNDAASYLNSFQDSLINQFQDLTGTLPEVGPLSSSYRQRMLNSIYFLILGIIFLILAIFVGLPTIFLKPAKFIICITFSTFFFIFSMITLKTWKSFLILLMNGNMEYVAPFFSLVLSSFFTIYIVVFKSFYIYIIAITIIQLASLIFFLSTFIPGGTKGLLMVLKMAFNMVLLALKPVIFIIKKYLSSIFNS